MKSETMKLCRVGALAGLTALLVACGDDVTNTTNNVTGAKTVADLAAAGACNADATGEIVLNSEDGALYVCNGKKWITMKGGAGETGEPGAPGNPGAAGASCEATSIAGVGIEVSCGGVIVDTLKNGAKGDPGDPGDPGTSCEATSIAGVGIEVSCGGVVVDTLKNGATGDGCTSEALKDDQGVARAVVVTCGDQADTLVSAGYTIGYCNGSMFNATNLFCDDRDGKLYKFVTIGEQTWMAENLNYADSAAMPSLVGRNRCYNDSAKYCAQYGRLYTWGAAMDSVNTGCGYYTTAACTPSVPFQGVCPNGWHLPDSSEWSALLAVAAQVDGAANAGVVLKSDSKWMNAGNGTDVFGFNALPAGLKRSQNSEFEGMGSIAIFWSATPIVGNYPPPNASNHLYAYNMSLWADDGGAYLSDYDSREDAMSVRCVKD